MKISEIFELAAQRIKVERHDYCCTALASVCALEHATTEARHEAFLFFTEKYRPVGVREDDSWFGDFFEPHLTKNRLDRIAALISCANQARFIESQQQKKAHIPFRIQAKKRNIVAIGKFKEI